MNKKHITLISFIFVFAFLMQCFCSPIEDYTKSVLNDISKSIRKTEKGNVIFSWEKGNREKEDKKDNEDIINRNEFPCPVGKMTTHIIKSEKLGVKYLGTNCVIKRDAEGRSAIAYHDMVTNEAVIAYHGFYIVDKEDEITHEIRRCKYYADETGYILSGWLEENDGTKYYMSEDSRTYGEVIIGDMQFSDGKVYSFNENGVLIGVR